MDPYKSALTAHILYETQNSELALMRHIWAYNTALIVAVMWESKHPKIFLHILWVTKTYYPTLIEYCTLKMHACNAAVILHTLCEVHAYNQPFIVNYSTTLRTINEHLLYAL